MIAGGLALAGCTPVASSTKAGTVSLTSSLSTTNPKAGVAAILKGFEAKTKNAVKLDIIPGVDFSNTIATYLSGSPADTFTWFGGYRMRYYASKGLLTPVDDVWDKIGKNFNAGVTNASKGSDGKKYLIPNYNYPWAVFYRKSVWEANGWEPPTTWDDFIALAKKMKAAGLTPISFGDKDGFPAMGTFDYLNLRLNGYQFHVDLCAHKESWNQKKVQDVFDSWKELAEYTPAPSQVLGATWQDATAALANKQAGMFLFGSFLTQAITDPSIVDDLDLFPFPEMKTEGQEAIEAPLDGWLMTKKGGSNPVAKQFMEYLGTPEAQQLYYSKDPSNIQTAKGFDTSQYTPLNKKASDLMAKAKFSSQFFDRDALPAMASNVITPALQGFIRDGAIDLANIESQAKTLYGDQ
jgi:multiple sugar transport system substrate-binding protein